MLGTIVCPLLKSFAAQHSFQNVLFVRLMVLAEKHMAFYFPIMNLDHEALTQ